MARKRYSIYKLTAPSGRAYVGFTSQSVQERWRQHVARAATGVTHPLCAAVRKYGAEAFSIETLAEYADLDVALRAEVAAIAALTDAYNISPGGDFDSGAGAAKFRELLLDPAWRANYSARLSAALKASPPYQAKVPEAVARLVAWRIKNPTASYKNAMRALRICANRNGRKKPDTAGGRLPRTPKGPAAKFHKSIASREAAKRHWSGMDPDKKADIKTRIAASVAENHAAKSAEERGAHAAQLAQARGRIDHAHRKARQKEALQDYWTPERRTAFGAKVRARNAAKKDSISADV